MDTQLKYQVFGEEWMNSHWKLRVSRLFKTLKTPGMCHLCKLFLSSSYLDCCGSSWTLLLFTHSSWRLFPLFCLHFWSCQWRHDLCWKVIKQSSKVNLLSVYVIAWAWGQLRNNFTSIFKVFTKLPESRSRSDEGNLENFENTSEINP